MSVLTGKAIEIEIARGNIEVTPYDPSLINDSSLDLRLGNKMIVYSRFATINANGQSLATHLPAREPIDVKQPEPTSFPYEFDGETGFVLQPGILYLMHTHEVVCAKKYRPEVHGKSSIGRLGIFVHVTAGLGEPGFDGQGELSLGPVGSRIWKQFKPKKE
jgi:dCTP deaminase